MYASYGNYSGRLLRGDLDFHSTPLRGHVGTVKYGDGVARQVSTGEVFSVVGKGLHKILKLVGVPMLPILIRGGMAPPLLGARLLHHVDIPEKLLLGTVSFEGIYGIQIAACTVIVGKYLQPVVNPAQHEFRREDIGHCAVLKGNVYLAIVFDVLVIRAEEPCVAKGLEACYFVRASGNCGSTYGLAAARFTLGALQVKDCR
jgi:hypothetical protein